MMACSVVRCANRALIDKLFKTCRPIFQVPNQPIVFTTRSAEPYVQAFKNMVWENTHQVNKLQLKKMLTFQFVFDIASPRGDQNCFLEVCFGVDVATELLWYNSASFIHSWPTYRGSMIPTRPQVNAFLSIFVV